MIKTALRLMFVSMLALFAVSANAVPVIDIFMCEQDEEATREQLHKAATAWLQAARTMEDGDQLELSMFFPVVAKIGEHDFAIVLKAPSLEVWGRFLDNLEGSAAHEAGKEFRDLADCTDNALWEIVKIE